MADVISRDSDALVQDLRALIEEARGRVARAINSELVAVYWEVGKRLRAEVGEVDRAAYGGQVVAEIAGALSAECGRGFTKRNLYSMMKFAEVFSDAEIVHALRAQLSWTHFRRNRSGPLKVGSFRGVLNWGSTGDREHDLRRSCPRLSKSTICVPSWRSAMR